MASGSDRPPELRVQSLNRVCRINDPAHGFGEREEWDDVFPGPAPALGGRRVFPALLTVLEGIQCRQSSLLVVGANLETAVDMTLRLDNAGALSPCPRPQQQRKFVAQ